MLNRDTDMNQKLVGEVVAVCRSEKKGEAKEEIAEGYLKEDYGLEGDAHAGDWHRQVSLLGQADIEMMKEQGLELEHGAFGENLVTTGLELYDLSVGTKLKIGNQILLEVTQIGKECHDRCNIYHQVGDCIMPKRGIFVKVLEGAQVTSGDK